MTSKKVTYTLFSTLLFATTFQAFAYMTNQECIDIYRDGYVDLLESSKNFNAEMIDKNSFSTSILAIRSLVGVNRGVCSVIESPNNISCVQAYQGLYDELNESINLLAVAMGNQTQVAFDEYQAPEKRVATGTKGKLKKLFKRAKREVNEYRGKTRLGRIDETCRYN